MIDKNSIYAVVGVSSNPEKYGYKVFKDLLDSGYQVWGINPKAEDVLGQKIYGSLGDLPQAPDWVILVTQPAVSEKIVSEAINLGVKNIWLQPGSESEQAVSDCQKAGINCISRACIMIKRQEV